jgi:hypothetical protein
MILYAQDHDLSGQFRVARKLGWQANAALTVDFYALSLRVKQASKRSSSSAMRRCFIKPFGDRGQSRRRVNRQTSIGSRRDEKGILFAWRDLAAQALRHSDSELGVE